MFNAGSHTSWRLDCEVLVHGAFADGSGWKPVAGILAWSDAKFREFVKRIGWHIVAAD